MLSRRFAWGVTPRALACFVISGFGATSAMSCDRTPTSTGAPAASASGTATGAPIPVATNGVLPPLAAYPATVEGATAFIDRVDGELKKLWVDRERAGWVSSNFITLDSQEISAAADEATMQYLSEAIKASTRFDALKLSPEVRRKFKLLKTAGSIPGPSDPKKTAELAKLGSDLQAAYGKGKYCPKTDGPLRAVLASGKLDRTREEALKCNPDKPELNLGVPLGALTKVLAESRDEAVLREAWVGWRSISPKMRPMYKRYVEIANEGAKEIGFSDVGTLWRSGYDMPAEGFRTEVERLYDQVKPFYEELHCYTHGRLQEKYGKEVVADGAPIPAHLLGNMWSQTWGNVYPLVEPYPGQASIDVTAKLKAQKYDEVKMVKLAEGFFTSLGLDPLPKTFWERSLFKKPRDREVVCHASAWDVHYNNDLRIKMCIEVNEEELQVVHHELGHNYYYHYYYKLPALFQQGANDGFHEAIGDAIALSINPGYLKQIGLIDSAPDNEKAEINFLMKMALDKVAFLPFGKLIDQWRWDVFAGKIGPAEYNKKWWELRTKYQGITPPVERTEADFDPGAKYHVPSSVPYIRYFLAFIYQFQFQRALCREAGHEGPLHKCSIYGNKKAGAKLRALLKLGASKPWPEALKAMSGEEAADAGALLEYFKPVRTWLQEQNKGKKCGW